MELIAAIVLAGLLGRTREQGPLLYLLAWAVILPMQTVVVHGENADDINWRYALVNTVILAFGLGLNRLDWLLRQRRAAVRARA